ncbi:condensation domain-containing protein [Jatrophihabitans sp.]|uniref:condensation domain-containing protein n=1 Tax=Jatrophihabitans sp. TaxID=1932789 RepID=UPI002BA8C479|nr:condensation domain-containing protein [Jatrophihabitans sp.]
MTTVPVTSTQRRAELLEKLRRRRLQQDDQITAEPWGGPAEMSSQQLGLWLASELNPANTAYNMVTVMRLRGPFDVASLRGALSGLTDRHEALRTSFAEQDGAPRMYVAPAPGPIWLEQFDVSDVPEPNREQRALRLVADSCRQPMDLRCAPLLRVFLARLDRQDHLLGYVLHHIVADGWSMQLVVGELNERYRAEVEGRVLDLPPLAIQPSDVYRWQRNRLSADGVQRRLAQWREKLSGMPPLRLPLDRPRPAVVGTIEGRAVVELPPGLLARADELARAVGRTPFSVLLAAFAVLMQQRSGQYDLAVGSVLSGRVRTELEPLIGYFANTAVLRIRTAADQPVGQLIRHCHDVLLDAQETQDIPFADVVNAVAPERVPGTNPLFQVCFTLAYRGYTNTLLAIDGVQVEQLPISPPGSRFDLSFQVTERADGTAALSLEYAGELFDETTMLRLGADYGSILQTLLADADGAALTVGELQQASRLGTPATGQATIPAAGAEPGGTRAAGGTEASTPAETERPIELDDLREVLRQIWLEACQVSEDVGDDQSFFELGGTSLTAVRLRSRIVSELGIDIPLADIYAGGSVLDLLPHIQGALAGGPDATDAGLPNRPAVPTG